MNLFIELFQIDFVIKKSHYSWGKESWFSNTEFLHVFQI